MNAAPPVSTPFEAALRAYEADPSDPAAFDRALASAADDPEAAKQLLLQGAEVASRSIGAPAPLPEEPEEPEERGILPDGVPAIRPAPSSNWGANIVLAAPQARQPCSTEEIKGTLALVVASRQRAKPIGAAHSSSIILRTSGVLIDSGTFTRPTPSVKNSALRQCRELSPREWYTLDAKALHMHVEVGAGARVKDVLECLAASGRALPMTGSYTGQTLVGAFMTSTHGAGVDHPPLQAAIRSIQLLTVNEQGKPQEYRIERSHGITDPAAYARARPGVTLLQDDDVFLSVAVSMGCMGFVASVIVETVPPYFLRQETSLTSWEEVRSLLRDVGANGVPKYFEGTYNGGVLFAPYREFLGKGTQRAVLSRTFLHDLQRTPVLPPGTLAPGGGALSTVTVDVARLVANQLPVLVPLALNMSLKDQSTALVFGPGNAVTGSANELPQGFSAEHGFRLPDVVPAMDAILSQMCELADKKQRMLVGPISLRYVGAAKEYMSMTHGEPRCFAEFLTLGSAGQAADVLAAIEPTALKYGSRPHWGQWFSPGAVKRIVASYPQYPRWRAVWKRLDPTGVFHNDFTDQLP